MQGEVKTKDIKDVPETQEQGFFYPEYGVTINAKTQEEADQKLQEIINNK